MGGFAAGQFSGKFSGVLWAVWQGEDYPGVRDALVFGRGGFGDVKRASSWSVEGGTGTEERRARENWERASEHALRRDEMR